MKLNLQKIRTELNLTINPRTLDYFIIITVNFTVIKTERFKKTIHNIFENIQYT